MVLFTIVIFYLRIQKIIVTIRARPKTVLESIESLLKIVLYRNRRIKIAIKEIKNTAFNSGSSFA